VKRFYLKEVEVDTYFEDFYESVCRCTCIASKNKRIIDKVYAIRSKIKKKLPLAMLNWGCKIKNPR
jgi:hypothetical protein